MMYSSWVMVRDRCNCSFSFWAIFYPFTPLTAQNINILKKWKKPREISSFYACVPKIMIRWCMVPEIWCTTDGWMDRQTDGRKKWHIEVGAPPKNGIKKKHHSNKFLNCLLVGCTKFRKRGPSGIWKVISPTSESIFLFIWKKTFL